MKKLNRIWSSLIIFAILGCGIGRAQVASLASLQASTIPLSGSNVTAIRKYSDAQLAALLDTLNSTPTVPADALPYRGIGTFWSLQNPGAPAPADVIGVDVWVLSDGSYLLNDANFDYSGASTLTTSANASMSMTAGSTMSLAAADASGGTVQAAGSTYAAPDYGTNLWLAQTGVDAHGILSGIVSNTLADVEYTIQTCSDLSQGNWQSIGSILGSELTNWTALSVFQGGSSNLFVRLRSEQSGDATGIPDWWETQYFGTNAVDPNAADSAGDGYSIYQKYQMGVAPNTWVTPAAPQLNVAYSVFSSIANLTWNSGLIQPTGYTIRRVTTDGTSSQTTDFALSGSTSSYQDAIAARFSEPHGYGPNAVRIYYQAQAHYNHGDSVWSARKYVEPDNQLNISLVSGSQGAACLAVGSLPSGTMALAVSRLNSGGSLSASNTIYLSSSTNGIYPLPQSIADSPLNSVNTAEYSWQVTLLNSNYTVITNYFLTLSPEFDINQHSWLVKPYLDGRQQLKQNLSFILRAALTQIPFCFTDVSSGHDYWLFTNQTQYAVADFNENNIPGPRSYTTPDPFVPFAENFLLRNFAFNITNVDSYGAIATGVGGDFQIYPPTVMYLFQPTTFEYAMDVTNGQTITPILSSVETRWLSSFPTIGNFDNYLNYIGMSSTMDANNNVESWQLASNVRNYWGLPFESVLHVYPDDNFNLVTNVIYRGGGPEDLTALAFPGGLYPRTADPQFTTIAYQFWLQSSTNNSPGGISFAVATNGDLLIVPVGSSVAVNGYAKLGLANGYANSTAYLGQYFDAAYTMTNGVATSTNTGVLSPYGEFFATQPGEAALVTMPDIDPPYQRGTGSVYCISLNLDKNHDGTMDLSFNGPDRTSPYSPYVFWINNNFDRLHSVDGSDTEQDDVLQGVNDPSNLDQQDADYNYSVRGNRVIPCARDLEDFSRLWVCGITSNLFAALPSGTTITLNWGDQTLVNASNPTIDLFTAADVDGGIGYQTNTAIAMQQTNVVQCPYIGRLAPGGSVQLNSSQFNGWAGNHFIWCGVSNGIGGLNITIADTNGNLLAQSTAYIQIKDIKQIYERWTVGDNPNIAPALVATNATDGGLTSATTPFQYGAATSNMTYILHVHGWNMQFWEKDRYAETEFKRLYWQGYQGRFGEFRWPTYFNFPFAEWQWQSFDLKNFNNSENNAWNSGAGLLNLLKTLNAEYPGQVYLTAHSMGNVVAGEALRLSGTNRVVNTYVAMQAAVSAHSYDPTTPDSSTVFSTPDRYAQYYTNGAPCYFNQSAGAGTYVNFFNPGDFALNGRNWPLNQSLKPSVGYGYSAMLDLWYEGSFANGTPLIFPGDTYKIFAYCDASHSHALGAQSNVNGVFGGDQVELDISPYGFSTQHKYHSGQFRSDNAQRWQFWSQVLVKMRLK